MQLRDLTMVFSSFASMAAGVFLPGLAGPLEAMPRLMLMVMLYLSFLAVGAGALWDELRAMPGIVCDSRSCVCWRCRSSSLPSSV